MTISERRVEIGRLAAYPFMPADSVLLSGTFSSDEGVEYEFHCSFSHGPGRYLGQLTAPGGFPEPCKLEVFSGDKFGVALATFPGLSLVSE